MNRSLPFFTVLSQHIIYISLLFLVLMSSFEVLDKAVRVSGDIAWAKQKGPSYTGTDYLHPNVSNNIGFLILTGVLPMRTKTNDLAFEDNNSNLPFQIMTGLELVTKGYKEKIDADNKSKTNLLYLKIPVCALYYHPLDKGEIFGGLGPYAAYGIGGKSKFTSGGTTVSFKSFDKDNGGYDRFDAGLTLLGGYKFSCGVGLSLGYDWGLVNIEDNGDDKTYTRTLSLNISYPLSKLIGGKK